MSIIILSVVALLAGWLATLVLQGDLETLSLLDVAVGVTGAVLVGSLLAPAVGLSTMSEYGLSLSGTLVSWLGAMSSLILVNLARHGHFLCGRRRQTHR